jgi:hypothetical protein
VYSAKSSLNSKRLFINAKKEKTIKINFGEDFFVVGEKLMNLIQILYII